MKTRIQIRIEEKLLNNFDTVCRQHGIDRSEAIRNLMFDFVNKYRKEDEEEEMQDMLKDVEASAAALYDGGWRAADREQLMAEYDLPTDDANAICALLEQYDAK